MGSFRSLFHMPQFVRPSRLLQMVPLSSGKKLILKVVSAFSCPFHYLYFADYVFSVEMIRMGGSLISMVDILRLYNK